MRIEQARTADDLAQVRRLWRLYQQEIDESLEHQGFEAEIASLPGVYAPRDGALLLAWSGADAVGTAALRPLGLSDRRGRVGELKRMVVQPSWRGRGVGRALVEGIVSAARGRYAVLKLDTSARWVAANRLYASCGFVVCERYNDDPHADTVFMEREL